MNPFWYLFGTALFVGTTIGLLKVLAVPRRAWSIVASPLLATLVWLFHSLSRQLRRRDTADRFLGFLGPLYVVALLVLFLLLYTMAFTVLLLPSTSGDLPAAMGEAGSSVFTLGFRSSDEGVSTLIDITAAATGMVVTALFIAYLPTLYAAVKERERFVKLVEGRLGDRDLTGVDLLIAHFERGTETMLVHLYRDAERWAVGLSETHSKYPVLLHFRAPRAPLHWLDTMVAVADAAVLHQLVVNDPPGETRAVVDAIALCLDDLAHAARVVPRPGDAWPAEEVAALVDRLRAVTADRPIEGLIDHPEAAGSYRRQVDELARAIGIA